jgi:hypothetical protein
MVWRLERFAHGTLARRGREARMSEEIFSYITSGGTSLEDLESLLALQRALGARSDFSYLELGAYLGRSLQSVVADPRCRKVIVIDRRDQVSPDERPERPEYPDNTTPSMLEGLARVPGADLEKVVTLEASASDLDPAAFNADLCFIDAEHTNVAALDDARFCRKVIRDHGVIVFHDRTLVADGIARFLDELGPYRAYPLAHDLFVVELGIASLLGDREVRGRVTRRLWVLAARLHATAALLRLSAALGRRRAARAR